MFSCGVHRSCSIGLFVNPVLERLLLILCRTLLAIHFGRVLCAWVPWMTFIPRIPFMTLGAPESKQLTQHVLPANKLKVVCVVRVS